MQDMKDWCQVHHNLLAMQPTYFERVAKLQQRSAELGEPEITELDILVAILTGGLFAMEHEMEKDSDTAEEDDSRETP